MARSDGGQPGAPAEVAAETVARKRQNRDLTRIGAAVVIVACLVAFVLDNSQTVKVGFIVTSSSVPLIWVLLVTALLGVAADRLFMWKRAQHRRAQSKARPKRR